MWGANYVLRVYRDCGGSPVRECGFWGQTTDDDVEAMQWLEENAADWSPAYRLELQTEKNGWVQTLKVVPGALSCGHDRRDLNGRCNDGSWCS